MTSTRRRQRAREDGDGQGVHAASEEGLERIPIGEPVACRLPARALGDDRLERVRVRGCVDEHLAADRESDSAKPLWVDIRAAAEIGRCRMEVAVAHPAEAVRIAFASALAAPVEEQDAVAVADEHPGVLLRP